MGSAKRPALAALALTIALALTSCDGSPVDDTVSPAQAASSPGMTAVDVENGPLEGTCWDVPVDAAVDPDYWFDESPRVSCSDPQPTETCKSSGSTIPPPLPLRKNSTCA